MSTARSIYQGNFGRVALLHMDRSLVPHAHRACHVLFKAGGADTAFSVRGKTCELTDGSAVVVNAWEQHAYNHVMQDDVSQILALYIDPSWLASIDRQLIVSGHADFFSIPNVEVARQLRDRVHDLAALMTSIDVGDYDRVARKVFDVMIDVIDTFSDRRTLVSEQLATRSSDYRVSRAINWLRTHVHEPLDMETMAKHAGLSRSHLFAQFREVTQLTPAMFLNTLRMEAAHPKLVECERPLIEVAQEVGFNAPGNFSRFFREHQGITPSEYRRVTKRVD